MKVLATFRKLALATESAIFIFPSVGQDVVMHNVTEEKRKAWASPSLATGNSWKMVMKERANFYWSLHPVMKGKIQVK